MITDSNVPNFTLFGETRIFPDVVHCEAIKDRAPVHGWQIEPHRHAEMAQIFQISGGMAEVVLDRKPHTISAGTLFYVPAQIVHSMSFEPDTEGRVISLPTPVVQTIGPINPALTDWLSSVQILTIPDGFEPLAKLLEETFLSTGAYRAQRLVGLAHALLSALAEASPKSPDQNLTGLRRLQELDALITDGIGKGLSVSDYASAMNITAGQLSRICRSVTGQSAQTYVETAVMTEAKRMLAFTQMPVSEVGYRLGYTDPAYFSRRFRVFSGQTPSEYRAAFMG